MVKGQSKNYSTNQLIATMGGDFFYENAEHTYHNLEILMNSVNSMQNEIYLLYLTPNCYLKAINNLKRNYTDIKHDDFMPYADFPDAFWTGYYTSRPRIKYHVNYANNILQLSKQLIVLADIYSTGSKSIRPLQETVAITSHHDAITGTSKQFVIEDYMHMLDNGLFRSQTAITEAYQKFLNTSLVPQFCHQLNISQCLVTENISDNNILKITVYNPLAHRISHYLSLPIVEQDFQITDSEGKLIDSEVGLEILKF
jgi:lysosomal alpha-mannosidase